MNALVKAKVAPARGAKRKRNFEKFGNVKIPWCRLSDGRTCIDPRKYARKRQAYRDHEAALHAARKIALEISQGGEEAPSLTSEERAAFAHATAEAGRHRVDLLTAITEWAETRRLADGLCLVDTVRAGAAVLRVTEHRVVDVVLELITAKSKEDINGRYFRGLQKSLQNFAGAMGTPIERVMAADIETYLDAIVARDGIGPRRRNNILHEIRHLFEYAKLRSYVADNKTTEARKVPIIKRVRSKIGIITPEVMQLHFRFVSERFTPWLWVNSMSGVRAEEIVLTKDAAKRKDPLRWEDFDWDEREICVREETSKTFTARRIPLLDNLYAALAPWREAKAKGPICPPSEKGKVARLDHERHRFIECARLQLEADWQRDLAENPDAKRSEIDLSFSHNAYRHSYGSYRLAILGGDMQKLAYEMGNSVKMIKRNYNNPRPIRQAREYFGIFRQLAGNVVQFPSRTAMQLQMPL
jgi:hypothetical protein